MDHRYARKILEVAQDVEYHIDELDSLLNTPGIEDMDEEKRSRHEDVIEEICTEIAERFLSVVEIANSHATQMMYAVIYGSRLEDGSGGLALAKKGIPFKK